MNKLSKEKRDKLILVSLGTLVVCAVYWYFVISAQGASQLKYQQDIRDVQDKIYKAELRIKRASLIETELAELKEKVAAVEAELMPIEQLNANKWMLDKLNNFITNRPHAVKLTRLVQTPLTGKQFLLLPKFAYAAAAYDADVQAFYHDFGKFLADFENHFSYLRLQDFTLWPIATPSAATGRDTGVSDELPEGDGLEQLKATVRIVALYKPLPSP